MKNNAITKKSDYLVKTIFYKHYLPFSLNEMITLTVLILFYGMFIFSAILNIETYTFSFTSLLLLFLFPLFLLIIFSNRFFIKVRTGLSFEENMKIVHEIIKKQKNVFVSVENKGLYMFEIQGNNDVETLVILCEDEFININSFANRSLTILRKKNIKYLKELILIKANK